MQQQKWKRHAIKFSLLLNWDKPPNFRYGVQTPIPIMSVVLRVAGTNHALRAPSVTVPLSPVSPYIQVVEMYPLRDTMHKGAERLTRKGAERFTRSAHPPMFSQ